MRGALWAIANLEPPVRKSVFESLKRNQEVIDLVNLGENDGMVWSRNQTILNVTCSAKTFS